MAHLRLEALDEKPAMEETVRPLLARLLIAALWLLAFGAATWAGLNVI